MNRLVFLLIAGSFWAVMMALLVQREVLPYLEFRDPPSYRSYLKSVTHPELTRQAIFMSGRPGGEIETVVVPHPNGTAELRSYVRFELPDVPGDDKNLWMASRTQVDRDRRLIRYDLRALGSGVPMMMAAVRMGQKVRIEMSALLFRRAFETPFDNDAVFTDGFLPYFGGKLSVGKKWRVKSLDIRNAGGDTAGISAPDLFATVEERKNINVNGEPMSCYEVVFRRTPTRDEDAISHVVYVNEGGTVVMTTLFFGRYVYHIYLVEKRTLTYGEAEKWRPSIRLPAGFQEPR